MTTNRKRAARCEAVIKAYSEYDAAISLADLLADAMHWADSRGRDFHFLLANAHSGIPKPCRRTCRYARFLLPAYVTIRPRPFNTEVF
jgi:hypothetical protein